MIKIDNLSGNELLAALGDHAAVMLRAAIDAGLADVASVNIYERTYVFERLESNVITIQTHEHVDVVRWAAVFGGKLWLRRYPKYIRMCALIRNGALVDVWDHVRGVAVDNLPSALGLTPEQLAAGVEVEATPLLDALAVKA
jgi:hypothetical protein